MRSSHTSSKFVVVTGGVMSGLGKGILAASIANLLKSCGYRVSIAKIDPYLNVDAGTMSPFEHGEVFVLEDGGEVDLDFGHYERFLREPLGKDHNITTGKVFKEVIEKERKGAFLGKTVQLVPHVTGHIKEKIARLGEGKDFLVVEVGGTVGDIEGQIFLEAIRQLKRESEVVNVHIVHVPLSGIDQKTKPTQHSIITLRRAGLLPEIIVGRCEKPLWEKTKDKISLFCDVEKEAVISDPTMKSVYELPLHLQREGIHRLIQEKFGMKAREPDMREWEGFVGSLNADRRVRIGIVGKYSHGDTYLSLVEAIRHAGAKLGAVPEIAWLDAERFRDGELEGLDALITPGGFGSRGTEGKVRAIRWARERRLPWLGLCLGFQLAVVEFARSLGMDANSTEFDPGTPEPVIIPHWEARQDVMGGTMRLGAIEVNLEKGSRTAELYGTTRISERHRHRYGLNPDYIERLERGGMKFTGVAPSDGTVEVLELPGQFFIGVQFHPEFKSRPLRPHPLFTGLIKAALTSQE